MTSANFVKHSSLHLGFHAWSGTLCLFTAICIIQNVKEQILIVLVLSYKHSVMLIHYFSLQFYLNLLFLCDLCEVVSGPEWNETIVMEQGLMDETLVACSVALKVLIGIVTTPPLIIGLQIDKLGHSDRHFQRKAHIQLSSSNIRPCVGEKAGFKPPFCQQFISFLNVE